MLEGSGPSIWKGCMEDIDAIRKSPDKEVVDQRWAIGISGIR
jgi:hypothetical protein